MNVNPLLDFSGLPRYKAVRPEHVAPAIDQLLAENRAVIARLADESTAASWDEFAEPLENANERLSRAWGTVAHLHAVDDNPAIRDAYNANLPKVTLYRAQVARASEFGRPEFDNTSIIARELRLRKENAQLLGYRSFAEFSLVPKMAESPEAALDFLNDLAASALPRARKDYAELEEFARRELGLEELQARDIAFASEKLRSVRYAFSDQEVKRYFTEPKVLEGMFRLVEVLYDIRILPDTGETWHPDARFFRITDVEGKLIGQFYLDPYSRETKRGGAWMDEAIARQRLR